jgi:hypothetical protein
MGRGERGRLAVKEMQGERVGVQGHRQPRQGRGRAATAAQPPPGHEPSPPQQPPRPATLPATGLLLAKSATLKPKRGRAPRIRSRTGRGAGSGPRGCHRSLHAAPELTQAPKRPPASLQNGRRGCGQAALPKGGPALVPVPQAEMLPRRPQGSPEGPRGDPEQPGASRTNDD